ncbi:molybdenum cofactor guanylyltransferase [Desulfovibrio ferrophilus]|uniref:Probable molybdenum cofactor guanylyltransferase n=1 Tax=Desulfovibrio ferrophilus TaxID=241368 RepID=A0A2Z6AVS7_9BACT|nr:molybdenum cofactor guanylyltransferase [Desulfovibrio ferrophilus]BBD07359.1 molybdenum cofactor guanylyltransferase [Desulfovibrio ferrophilus]
MSKGLIGYVLAGGKSTRLGRDKVILPYSGETLLTRTVSLASKFCDQIWISGRDPQTLGVNLPWMQDDEPGMGPLGGILTGLTRLNKPLLVLACDLPMLDETTVARLVTARKQRPANAVMTTFLQQETGWIEALVSIYEPQAAALLHEAGRQGLYKLSAALPPAVRHHVPYSQHEASPFFNINFPADLAMLRQVEGRETA